MVHPRDRSVSGGRAARTCSRGPVPSGKELHCWSRLAPGDARGDHAMIAIPAIDLRDGKCVQLVAGSYAAERIRLDDPIDVARRWIAAGFTTLHVVDLDAATGAGNNDALVESLL